MTLIYFPTVASAPTNLMAVQEGPTSIRVSWSPPTPLGNTTGYRIYYSGGSSGSEDVSDGSTDNYLLTDLQNGESYTISIVATSQQLPSESVIVMVDLGMSVYVKYRVIDILLIYCHTYLQFLDNQALWTSPQQPPSSSSP